MSMVVGGVVQMLRTARAKDTKALIITLEGAAERYKTGFRAYPPTDVATLAPRLRSPNQTNLGIEALVACLSTELKSGPFYHPPDESTAFCNTDNDALSSIPTSPYYKTTNLLEYQDSWGNPLTYLNSKDYGTTARTTMVEGGETTYKVPLLAETKTFPNKHTFVIVSAGADGMLGTEDDVKNY
jgi:hypothetical protein